MRKQPTSKKPPTKAKRSRSKAKKAMPTNGLPASRSVIVAKKNIGYFRELFADNLPGTLEVRPPFQDHPIVVLLRHVDAPLFFSLSSERPSISIQEDLIEIMKTSGVNDIEDQYMQACRSARSIFFDCATRQFMKHLKAEEGNLDNALYRALMIEDPTILHGSEKVSEFLADGIVKGGSRFLRRLAEDFKNAERRKVKLGVDDLTWVMAANWTNPHCPLWLMERQAIHAACIALGVEIEINQDDIDNRLKRKGFKRSRSTPIFADPTQASALSIGRCVVKGSDFTSLHGKKYPAPLGSIKSLPNRGAQK